MSIGQNIKNLRNKKGITQKDLAEAVYVSPQAVSRWENDEVEPSIGTLQQMSTLFEVSIDELIKGEQVIQVEDVVSNQIEQQKVLEEKIENLTNQIASQKQVVGTCDNCGKPIYVGDNLEKITKKNIIRHGRTHKTEINVLTYCEECATEYHKEIKKKNFEAKQNAIAKHKAKRTKSFVFGILAAFAYAVIIAIGDGSVALGVVGSIFIYCLVACICLDNNAAFDIFETISIRGGIRLPFGIIFDSMIDLLLFRLALAILSIFVAVIVFCIGTAISGCISVFIYPFALVKSFNNDYDEEDLIKHE